MHLFEDDEDDERELSQAARQFSARMHGMEANQATAMRPPPMSGSLPPSGSMSMPMSPKSRSGSMSMPMPPPPPSPFASSMYEPVFDRSVPTAPGADDGGMQPQFYRRPQYPGPPPSIEFRPPNKGDGKGEFFGNPMMPPNTSQGKGEPFGNQMMPPVPSQEKGKGKGKGKWVFEPVEQPPAFPMMPPSAGQGMVPSSSASTVPPPMLPFGTGKGLGKGKPFFEPMSMPAQLPMQMASPSNGEGKGKGKWFSEPTGPPPPFPTIPVGSFSNNMEAPGKGIGKGPFGFEPMTLGKGLPAPGPPPSFPTVPPSGKGFDRMPPPSFPVPPPPSSPVLPDRTTPVRENEMRDEPETSKAKPALPKQDMEQVQVFPDAEKPNKCWFNMHHFMAYMFTFVCFLIFAGPTIISIQLAQDYDVAYWIGRWGNLAVLIPFFLIAQHLYHTSMINQRRGLQRSLFLVVPVLPSIFLMFIGGTYMSHSRYLYGQLKSESCASSDTLTGKFRLQEAYEEAHAAWEQCTARRQRANFGLKLRRKPVLQSCDEWEDLNADTRQAKPWKGYDIPKGELRAVSPDNYEHWQYLANVEANHVCGGFCEAGPSLWVSFSDVGRQGGACKQYVAFKFLAVMHYSTMVFFIAAGIFVISFPLYFSSRSILHNMGYHSDATLF